MKSNKEYIDLVQKFPLIPIKDDRRYKQAMQVSLELGKKDFKMSAAEYDYFSVLALLIRDYESNRVKDRGSASPQELLRYLMEEHNFKQVDIARIIGHESHISAFLAGKRNLSKAEAIKLGTYFAIEPVAFLPPVWQKAG